MTKLTPIYDRVQADLQVDHNQGKRPDIVEFATNPYYFGSRVNPAKFKFQAVMLKAFYSLPLIEWEIEWLMDLNRRGKTNWQPNQTYRILVELVGQRSGKSFDASLIAGYEITEWLESDNPHYDIPVSRGMPAIGRGAPVEVKIVATSKENVRDHEFAELKAFIENSPYYQNKFNIDKKSRKLEIEFEKGLNARCAPAQSKSIRGGTSLMAIISELDHMTATTTGVGALEVYTALDNTTATLNGRIAIITSPLTEDGPAYQMFRQAIAGEINDCLVFNLSTFEKDPTLSPDMPYFKEYALRKPEEFKRDFMAIPAGAKEPYFSMFEWLERCWCLAPPGNIAPPDTAASLQTEKKIMYELINHVLSDRYPVLRKVRYVLAVDPSERNDAFGFCLCHQTADNQHIDVDLVGRFTPQSNVEGEIDAVEVKSIFIGLCQKFKPVFLSDMYGYTELRQSVRNMGVRCKDVTMDLERANNAKLGIYFKDECDTYPFVRCYRYPQLIKELRGMELVNGRKVEYPRKTGQPGHGDVAIAVMHAVAELYDPTTRTTIREITTPWGKRHDPYR